MITFHLHKLREFVQMTIVINHEFDDKPLTVFCIFSITDDNGVPVTAESLTRKLCRRVNIGDKTAAVLHKPQHGSLAVPCSVPYFPNRASPTDA